MNRDNKSANRYVCCASPLPSSLPPLEGGEGRMGGVCVHDTKPRGLVKCGTPWRIDDVTSVFVISFPPPIRGNRAGPLVCGAFPPTPLLEGGGVGGDRTRGGLLAMFSQDVGNNTPRRASREQHMLSCVENVCAWRRRCSCSSSTISAACVCIFGCPQSGAGRWSVD